MTKLTSDIKQNSQLFISDSQKSDTVWGLCNGQGHWLSLDSSEFESTEVMPFWSQQEDARAVCQDEWADFTPEALSLSEFVEDWLVSLANEGVLIGVNWTQDLAGEELEPKALVERYL